MSETVTITIPRHDKFPTMPPTEQCLVCDTRKNPKANVVDRGIPWLCPECKKKIGKLIGVRTAE